MGLESPTPYSAPSRDLAGPPEAPRARRARRAPGPLALALLVAVGGLTLAIPRQGSAKLPGRDYKSILKKLDQALRGGDDLSTATAVRELAADDSDRAVRIVGRVLQKRWAADALFDATKDFAAGLKSERALKALRRQLLKARPWQARVVWIEAAAKARGRELTETLGRAIQDKESRVALSASRQLGQLKTLEATEALIAGMEWLESKNREDVVWQDCRNVLGRVLGTRLDKATDYRGFLASRRDQFVNGLGLEGAPGGGARRGGGGDTGTVTLFGEPIRCKNVVLILDHSGSMVLKDPYPRGSGPKVGTSARDREDDRDNAWARDPKRERMYRAKQELKRAAAGLAEAGAKVNVVVYSTEVDLWKPVGLHKLNGPNLTSLQAFVDGLKADGVTATDTAILTAFDQIAGADCFYLISDGFATHDGESKIPTSSILDLISEQNRFRKVQINTFGFEARSGNPKDGADRELMEGIAALTGGTYTEVP